MDPAKQKSMFDALTERLDRIEKKVDGVLAAFRRIVEELPGDIDLSKELGVDPPTEKKE